MNTERLTSCIKHLAVSGLSSVTARIKSSCNLIGNRFVMPNVSYTRPLMRNLNNPSVLRTPGLVIAHQRLGCNPLVVLSIFQTA